MAQVDAGHRRLIERDIRRADDITKPFANAIRQLGPFFAVMQAPQVA